MAKEVWCKFGNKTLGSLQSVRVERKRWDRLFGSGVPKFCSEIWSCIHVLGWFWNFWKISWFFEFTFWFLLAKARSLPLFNCRGIDFLILYPLATLKHGEKEKFGKCIKVPILFVRGCNFTRCRLNNNIPLLTTNSKCYSNIYIKWTK